MGSYRWLQAPYSLLLPINDGKSAFRDISRDFFFDLGSCPLFRWQSALKSKRNALNKVSASQGFTAMAAPLILFLVSCWY